MSYRTGIDLVSHLLPLVAALAVPLTVFSKDNIQTYRVPKESAPAKATPPASPESRQRAKPLTWTLPQGWQEVNAAGVRVASFIITGKSGSKAELNVMPFPGTVGGEPSNVNRWRREVGLDEITEKEITSEPVLVGAETAKLFEAAGPKDTTLVAWLMKNDTSWFFKLRGEKTTVSEAKTSFIQFLKSVRFVAAPSLDAANAVADNPVGNPHGQAALPAGHPEIGDKTELPAGHPQIGTPTELPKGHPPISAAQTNTPPELRDPKTPNLPTWQTPAHWKEQSATSMVIKSYTVGEDASGKANITISSFPGDVGGLLANVNRWRSQLGLAAIAEGDLAKFVQPLDPKSSKASLVQMDASPKPVRLVGVIVPRGSDTWFYKMVGDTSVVDKEKENLVKLVQTARYP